MTFTDNPTTYIERLENALLSFNREKEVADILNEIRQLGYNHGYAEGIDYGYKTMVEAFDNAKNSL